MANTFRQTLTPFSYHRILNPTALKMPLTKAQTIFTLCVPRRATKANNNKLALEK